MERLQQYMQNPDYINGEPETTRGFVGAPAPGFTPANRMPNDRGMYGPGAPMTSSGYPNQQHFNGGYNAMGGNGPQRQQWSNQLHSMPNSGNFHPTFATQYGGNLSGMPQGNRMMEHGPMNGLPVGNQFAHQPQSFAMQYGGNPSGMPQGNRMGNGPMTGMPMGNQFAHSQMAGLPQGNRYNPQGINYRPSMNFTHNHAPKTRSVEQVKEEKDSEKSRSVACGTSCGSECVYMMGGNWRFPGMYDMGYVRGWPSSYGVGCHLCGVVGCVGNCHPVTCTGCPTECFGGNVLPAVCSGCATGCSGCNVPLAACSVPVTECNACGPSNCMYCNQESCDGGCDAITYDGFCGVDVYTQVPVQKVETAVCSNGTPPRKIVVTRVKEDDPQVTGTLVVPKKMKYVV